MVFEVVFGRIVWGNEYMFWLRVYRDLLNLVSEILLIILSYIIVCKIYISNEVGRWRGVKVLVLYGFRKKRNDKNCMFWWRFVIVFEILKNFVGRKKLIMSLRYGVEVKMLFGSYKRDYIVLELEDKCVKNLFVIVILFIIYGMCVCIGLIL